MESEAAESFIPERRCATCRFLAVMDRRTGAVANAEVPFVIRLKGTPDLPFCFVESIDITGEHLRARPSLDALDDPQRAALFVETVQRMRPCAEWEIHEYGISAQEARKNRDMSAIEELRRQQTEMMLKFAEQQVEISHALKATTDRQADMTIAAGKESGRFNRLFAYFGAATLALALATLVFPNGVPHFSVMNGGGNPQPIVVITIAAPSETPIATVTVLPTPQ